jgi:hypothetical protein
MAVWSSGGGGSSGGVHHVVGLGRSSVSHRGGRHRPESVRRPFETGEREVADRWGRAAQSRAARFDLIRILILT